MYVCMHLCMYVWSYVVCVCVCMYVQRYVVCVRACVYVQRYVVCVCMYVCMHECLCMCMCACVLNSFDMLNVHLHVHTCNAHVYECMQMCVHVKMHRLSIYVSLFAHQCAIEIITRR
jgi:hypothetical protein